MMQWIEFKRMVDRWTLVKVARRPWAPRTFLEFAIKSGYVLDPSKTFCCPWEFSGILDISWTVVKSGPAQAIPAPEARSIFSAPSYFMTSCDPLWRTFLQNCHRPHLLNVNRYILFAHLKITGTTRQGPFQHQPLKKTLLKTIFFIKLIY